jgi:hypothetical protein
MEQTAHHRILRVASGPSARVKRPIPEIVDDLVAAARTVDDRHVREILVRSGIFHGRPERAAPESPLSVGDLP